MTVFDADGKPILHTCDMEDCGWADILLAHLIAATPDLYHAAIPYAQIGGLAAKEVAKGMYTEARTHELTVQVRQLLAFWGAVQKANNNNQ
ncbi:MAG: hypothetical protein HGA45_41760 [Chloroflexales bacterium]|nr:hypothetical protein [Chloroflexales bacterium]